jgi:hypothetical protein
VKEYLDSFHSGDQGFVNRTPKQIATHWSYLIQDLKSDGPLSEQKDKYPWDASKLKGVTDVVRAQREAEHADHKRKYLDQRRKGA